MLLALTSVATSPARGDVLIGVILSSTGPSAIWSSTYGLEDWPKTIGGEKITLIRYDDQGDPGKAAIQAKRLVAEHNVDALVSGSLSPNERLAIDGVARENNVAHLVIGAVTSAGFDSPTTSDAPHSLPDAVFEHMKSHAIKRIGFLGYSDAWGDLWLNALQDAEVKYGLQLSAVQRFTRGGSSVDIPVGRFINAETDALLIAATGASAVTVQRMLRQLGYNGLIYHTHGSAADHVVDIPAQDAANAIFPATPDIIFTIFAKHTLPNQLGPNALDAGRMLEQLIPSILQKEQPGSISFRKALREATEVAVARSLHKERTWTLVTFDSGAWALAQ